ncbi:MAG: hypothetical protein A2Y62_10940 [Candidatus Fischerbacteria bacterium RBG_13_37_8]|uniref:Biotin transporter n=1 Tax=Candidatus Fischerbacteria bacterium RBG_13_37_8 TaxID=1817863 RepID=A0A1F5VUQ5_9BACT|nr:MAG: hypothetical protein A2Y62_10940 [Candidatus Fischerbacteria bacterium RBG_13_37_8]
MITSSITSEVIKLCTVVIAIALGAFIRIPLPFTPVPITAQTFFVLLGSAYLGRRLAPLAIGMYLALGIMGLPFFTESGGGLGVLLGPTGGYLIGFWIVSLFIGKYRNACRSFQRALVLFFIASMIILISGTICLALCFALSAKTAIYLGMLPFLPGECMKVFIAALIFAKVRAMHT